MKSFMLKYKIQSILISVLTILAALFLGLSISERFTQANAETPPLVDKEKEEPTRNIEDGPYIKEKVEVEINTSTPSINDFIENYEPSEEAEENFKIIYSINNEELTPDITKLNNYDVTIIYKENEYKSVLNIVDTTKPNVEFKSIAIYENASYDVNSFINSYNDNSGSSKYIATFKNETTANLKAAGTYSILISVCDESNNCVEETVKLVINKKSGQNTSGNSSGGNSSGGNSGNSGNNNTNPSGNGNSGSGNNTNPDGNNTNPSGENKVTQETKKEILKTIPYNYGVKKLTYQEVVYEVSSDGTRKEISRSKTKTEMDYSGFNGTVSNMIPEAEDVNKKNAGSVNTILTKTNEYRAAVGVGALTLDSNLSVAANVKAMEIAYSNKFDHTRPGGKSWDTLYSTFFSIKGMSTPYKYGENLALGYSGDLSACEGWKNSPDHYSNIIDPTYKRIGIGKYTFNGRTYWVQVFAS